MQGKLLFHLSTIPVRSKEKSICNSGPIDIWGINKTSYGIELSPWTTKALAKGLRSCQWNEAIAFICILTNWQSELVTLSGLTLYWVTTVLQKNVYVNLKFVPYLIIFIFWRNQLEINLTPVKSSAFHLEFSVISSEFKLPELRRNVVSEGGTTIGKHLSSNMPFSASCVQHSSWSSSGSGVKARSWSRNCPMNTRSKVLWNEVQKIMSSL